MSIFDDVLIPEKSDEHLPIKKLQFSNFNIIPGEDDWGIDISIDIIDENGGTPKDIEIGLFLNGKRIASGKTDDWGNVIFQKQDMVLPGNRHEPVIFKAQVRGQSISATSGSIIIGEDKREVEIEERAQKLAEEKARSEKENEKTAENIKNISIKKLQFSNFNIIPGEDDWGIDVSIDVIDENGGTPKDIEIGLFLNGKRIASDKTDDWGNVIIKVAGLVLPEKRNASVIFKAQVRGQNVTIESKPSIIGETDKEARKRDKIEKEAQKKIRASIDKLSLKQKKMAAHTSDFTQAVAEWDNAINSIINAPTSASGLEVHGDESAEQKTEKEDDQASLPNNHYLGKNFFNIIKKVLLNRD